MYIASSDLDESGSTPIHLDATGAVNILVYSTARGSAAVGALWHIFGPEDSEKIRSYLWSRGLYNKDEDPIHARSTYLNSTMLAQLRELGV